MVAAEDQRVAAVEPEANALIASFATAGHFDRPEGGGFDVDVELLRRRDEDVPAVRLAPEDGRKQAHHGRAPDWTALVVPGPVAGNTHTGVAAAIRIPPLDRWQPPSVDQRLQCREADSLKLDRWAALRHGDRPWIASPRYSRQERRNDA